MTLFSRLFRPITRIWITLAGLPDRKGVTIVMIVHNEARHIAEWACGA